MKSGAKSEAAWLRFDTAKVPQSEVLEYSIKRPLLAASAVLSLTHRKSGSSESVLVTGRVEARIPFKNAWSFEVRSETQFGKESPFGFDFYEELQPGKTPKSWRVEQDELVYETNPINRIRTDESHPLSGQILNPILLLFALSSFSPSGERDLHSQFVFGSRLMALKLSPRARANDSATLVYEVRGIKIEALLNLDQIQDLPWDQTESYELDWDSQARAVKSLRFKVPVVGSLEIPLTRHQRA